MNPHRWYTRIKHRLATLFRKAMVGLAVTSAAVTSLSANGAIISTATPSFSQRVEKIKKAIDEMAPTNRAGFTPSVMQWGNWGNWPNWQNWGNWNNWNNWANWVNW
jgi:hypothetical protein